MTNQKNTPGRRALSMASMGVDIAGSYIGYARSAPSWGKNAAKQS